MQTRSRTSAHGVIPATTLAMLLLLTACTSAPALDTPRVWSADGNGGYVHAASGRVISEAQYTEYLALEVRNLVGARMAMSPAYCPPTKK